MKSMSYYDHSLQQFFSAAVKEKWFSNTVFIFCSDHWLVPTEVNPKFENVNSYRIPIIIYEPSVNKKILNNALVSQFDILGTLLSIGGYKENINSYGSNLLDSAAMTDNRYVFTKKFNSIYECISSDHILGYDPVTERPEYFYNYKLDPTLSKNLLNNDSAQQRSLIMMKAFLQKASMEYLHQSFK
jgi:phosphoglycerol transferase MdoB-like AlkP superfamily enzyme